MKALTRCTQPGCRWLLGAPGECPKHGTPPGYAVVVAIDEMVYGPLPPPGPECDWTEPERKRERRRRQWREAKRRSRSGERTRA